MRHVVCALIALCGTAHAFSVTASPAAVLRIRGGDLGDIDLEDPEEETLPSEETDETYTPAALNKDEVLEKLNAIPTFAIMNSDGGVVGMANKDTGEKMVCWYVDPVEAKAVFEAVSGANPDAGLKLGVHGLGAAFTVCKGFAGEAADAEDDDGPKADASFDGVFKLRGNSALVAQCGPKLQEVLEKNGFDGKAWTLPVFLCEKLQGKQILPVFFSPTDLAETWKKTGREESDLPDDITVMDLRILVSEMMTDRAAWRHVHFVGSPEAVKLAQEQGAATA